MEKITNTKELLIQYVDKNIVDDWSKTPCHEKLNLLQNVKTWKGKVNPIKTRKIGNIMIPYIPHQFAEKSLNYVFNFNISTKKIDEKFEERDEEYFDNYAKTYKKRKVYEALVTIEFTFVKENGDKIMRTVAGTHKSYQNAATTKFDCIKAAMSQAWVVVARTFGIGSDLGEEEQKGFQQAEEETQKQIKPVTTKNYGY